MTQVGEDLLRTKNVCTHADYREAPISHLLSYMSGQEQRALGVCVCVCVGVCVCVTRLALI